MDFDEFSSQSNPSGHHDLGEAILSALERRERRRSLGDEMNAELREAANRGRVVMDVHTGRRLDVEPPAAPVRGSGGGGARRDQPDQTAHSSSALFQAAVHRSRFGWTGDPAIRDVDVDRFMGGGDAA